MAKDKALSAKSSIGAWLKHPVGGPILRDLLAQGGQTESALAPVKLFSLERVASMSGGRMPQEMIDDMVRRANDPNALAAAPVTDDDDEDDEDELPAPPMAAPWVERITPGRFDGKTVIVTGAGSGIGRAVAARVAAEGGKVVAVDISQERLDAAVAEMPGAVAVAGDITSEDAIAKVVAAAGGRVDGLANVAGIMDDMTPLHEVSDAVWSRVMAVNVEGTFRLTRAVLPLMLEAGGGSIVNVASEAGLRGSAAGLAYTTSKHAVVGLTKSTSFMYAGKNIRVNAVAPGPVATGIEASFASELGQERVGLAMTILPPIAEAAQLAASITWLLSDDATNVTGVILPSDGGWSAI
ncbi:MAG: short-chain dehydrogenase [Microbacterium sp. 67-17]|jgi:NAD(P)-dependent dehydrogenase (short-subunit alcohol dehydrogenase family)|uniref:SDR family NAD(P)-dependent oxidoreductase n=1 Tax=Microbacterium sp. 67-17 TaxID=1895782 RepID=UPI0009669D8F|nr:SDR family NAD(P)-dependent oxidoreductase [Microbacterium sp. 67-17]OJW01355.1 MAG: short-chain dehydrogenase [Microbacterium sp. 67-17]